MTHDQALAIVREFVKNENLVRHMLAVEAAMAAYAKIYGEDEEKWRVAGLLHDFDWEIHPTLDGHPQKGSEILRERGVSEEIIRAILSHAQHTGVSRDSKSSLRSRRTDWTYHHYRPSPPQQKNCRRGSEKY